MKNIICFGIGLTFLSLGYVWGQTYVENAQTRIPESLIECYRNQTLRHPENRPPMHIQTFIDLVRKVEKYQQNTEGVGILATSMLHRFRQDGIERSPDVVETEGVVPYAVKGNAFFKHRLILKYLISSNGYKFPNESLSQVELCTLHFMLSHSIERTLRGDESTVCSKVSNYESYRGSRIPRDTRFRRQVEAEEAALSKEYSESEKQLLNNIRDEESEENVIVTTPDLQGTSEELSVTNDSLEENPTLESKEVDQNDDSNSTHMADAVDFINGTSVNNQSKSGKFVFDDGFDIETNNQPAPRKLIGYTSSTRLTSPSYIDSSRPKPRVSVTSEESDCPVELGVVRTEWGSVSLGTVLAGIAAGLYSQQIQVQKLVAGGPRAHTLSAALSTSLVDNKFAATLTGDLAEVSLEQGPKATIKVGTNGGWNSTIYPRWYFDKERSDNQMTDAEIRGGLDGLILATKLQEWKNSGIGVLKLSSLLDMYYSKDGVFEERYRACQRKDLYSEVAPVETMREQAYRFATVLDQQTISSASVDDARVQEYAQTSVSRLMSYLPEMVDDLCVKTTTTETATSTIIPYANVTIVIDTRWDYNNIKKLLYYLMQQLHVGEYGSTVTIIDGKTGAPFLKNAEYSIDIDTNFTESSYRTHESGMDIPKALEQHLKTSMQHLLNEERSKNLGGGRSTIVLFIPSETVNLNQNDLSIAQNQIKNFKDYLPDVKFLYLAPGNKENYQYLVESTATDVFTYTTFSSDDAIRTAVDPVVNRIKQVPIRLTNPNCGSDWNGNAYNRADFTYSVKQYGTNYHKLHANYFFSVGSAEIKIQGMSSNTLKVCHSRQNEYPNANSTNDAGSTCQQITQDTMTIPLTNPCDGFDHISQCPPMYISISSVSQVKSYDCNDCLYPHNVKYTISNTGLVCTAGVANNLGNSFLIITAATLLLILRNLCAGR